MFKIQKYVSELLLDFGIIKLTSFKREITYLDRIRMATACFKQSLKLQIVVVPQNLNEILTIIFISVYVKTLTY